MSLQYCEELIFGFSEPKYVLNKAKFGDDCKGKVDLIILRKLLEVCCVQKDDRYREAPFVGQFLSFLEKYSKYNGCLLGYLDKSCKVVVDGMFFVSKLGEQFPIDLVNDFAAKFCIATSFSASRDRLYCWWE